MEESYRYNFPYPGYNINLSPNFHIAPVKLHGIFQKCTLFALSTYNYFTKVLSDVFLEASLPKSELDI